MSDLESLIVENVIKAGKKVLILDPPLVGVGLVPIVQKVIPLRM